MSSLESSPFMGIGSILFNFYTMFRPAVHKETGRIDTIDIEQCPNLDEYIIVGIANESIINNSSLDVNGNPLSQEVPTRATALQQEAEYENKLISDAVETNKRRKSN